jgi:septum formation protein
MPQALSCEGHCQVSPRPLVLASASPRRKDLLLSLGIEFEVDPSAASEAVEPGLDIAEIVTTVATRKALDVAPRHPEALIIAADTLVRLDAMVFGKPNNASEAREMLRQMSGRSHRVYTGLVLLDAASMELESRVIETEVRFRDITRAEIDAYVGTKEPLDKAGGYGMQGLGAVFVERIIGDFWNVVGLPLAALNELLTATGSCLICRRVHASSRGGSA